MVLEGNRMKWPPSQVRDKVTHRQYRNFESTTRLMVLETRSCTLRSRKCV